MTESETLFQQFLTSHGLAFMRVAVAKTPRPDFLVVAQAECGPMFFEVKEITSDNEFPSGRFGVSTRTIGDHIRSKITQSTKQMKYGAELGIPSILVVYNALDTKFHLFGTEDHDFEAAMLGELTLKIDTVERYSVQGMGGTDLSARNKTPPSPLSRTWHRARV